MLAFCLDSCCTLSCSLFHHCNASVFLDRIVGSGLMNSDTTCQCEWILSWSLYLNSALKFPSLALILFALVPKMLSHRTFPCFILTAYVEYLILAQESDCQSNASCLMIHPYLNLFLLMLSFFCCVNAAINIVWNQCNVFP